MKRIFLFVVTALLLNACAVQAPLQTQRGPVGALMAQADQFSAKGDSRQAIALIERAVRIEPRNGHAWLRLAKLYFESGDLNKAEQFARRAKQFAGADKSLQRQCQQLLEKVRSQLKGAG